ncbi:MAG: hypothetical protein EOP42_12925 [Sphingobacteriaceae bacterium]|nr:MAG: hypothetical protein EOP42_12925 [Sphingobacteriaceae bacterium]
MKILCTVFITLFSLNASAQFFTKIFPHKRKIIYLNAYSIHLKPDPKSLNYNTSFTAFNHDLGRSKYSIQAEEAFIMQKLKHSARYGQLAMRIEFDNLANFYLSHNRFSEAKWYLLRSNAISRNQKNYGQIIGSLLVLAEIKADLGDYKQADEDLAEAKAIAVLHTLMPDLQVIEQHANQIKQHKETGLKIQNQYADYL